MKYIKLADYSRTIPTRSSRSADIPSEQILDMDSVSGAFADVLAPGLWGGERAGRAVSMAKAVDGEDAEIPFKVRHPQTSDLLALLAGGAGGAALGAAGGSLIGGALNRDRAGLGATATYGPGAVVGGVVGGLAGSVIMPLINAFRRRKAMKDIVENYDQTDPESRKPVKLRHDWATSLLLPFGNSHRKGQADAVESMATHRTVPHGNIANLLTLAGGGFPIQMLRGVANRGRIEDTADASARQRNS